MKICEKCGKTHETRSKRFCSRKCMWNARPSKKTKLVEVICPICGELRILKLQNEMKPPSNRCFTCFSNESVGSHHPRWRGGHRHWSPGRYGKDKNGLSWKIQRKLAWERDNFECQHCHEKKTRKPDVHHINPWMNSQSHALDNLICLCQSFHLKEEAKVHEVWGGQLIEKTQMIKKDKKPRCSCGHGWLLGNKGLCMACWKPILIEEAKNSSIRGIALKFELSYHTVEKLLRKTKPH